MGLSNCGADHRTFGDVVDKIAADKWPMRSRWWLRVYAMGLVLLVMLPESPWDGSDYNAATASLHTVVGAISVAAFVFGAAEVSSTRARGMAANHGFDWLVIAGLAVIPQVMLLAVHIDGLFQRIMVSPGYIWLITESTRLVKHLRSPRAHPDRTPVDQSLDSRRTN